jgi:hypothetical protein
VIEKIIDEEEIPNLLRINPYPLWIRKILLRRGR